MGYVIHKKSRMPANSSYNGITWDNANLRHLHKDVYSESEIELVLALTRMPREI